MRNFLISFISALSLLLPFGASAAFTIKAHVDVVEQELGYHLPTKIQDGTIEVKVRKNHTNGTNGQFYPLSFDRNMFVLRVKYLNSWLCATGKDTSKCVSSFIN